MDLLDYKALKIEGNVRSDVVKVFFLMLRHKEGTLDYTTIFTSNRYDYMRLKCSADEYADFVDYVSDELRKMRVNLDGEVVCCFDVVVHNRGDMYLFYQMNERFYRFVMEKNYVFKKKD